MLLAQDVSNKWFTKGTDGYNGYPALMGIVAE
jgi:hypothetical protein